MSSNAGAQTPDEFPSRTVRIVVPAAPGFGGADTLARMFAEELSKEWRQPVVIENKPGAGGMIGSDTVVRASPDGYTILIGLSALLQQPFIYKKLPYDALTDLAPVMQIDAASNLLVTAPGVPADDFAGLVSLLRSKPGTFSYGSWGYGSTPHIQGELFKFLTKTDAAHATFNGSTPIMTALTGGHISYAFIDVGTGFPFVEARTLKLIAVTGIERLEAFPGAPTLKELGYPGFEPRGWRGFFLPAKTPPAVVQRIADSLIRVLRMPEISARIRALNLQIVGSSPTDFARSMREESASWGSVIRSADIAKI